MSIRLRAILILGLIEFLTLFIIITISLGYLYDAAYHQIETRAKETAVLLRTAIGESLMIEHLPSVTEIVDTAFYDLTDINFILVLDDTGKELARKKRGRALLEKNNIIIEELIELGSVELGKVIIHYSTQQLIDLITRQSILLFSFAIAGLSLSAWVTGVATYKMTKAFSDIENSMQAMLHNKTPQLVEYNKNNELGHLVNSYNELVIKLKDEYNN